MRSVVAAMLLVVAAGGAAYGSDTPAAAAGCGTAPTLTSGTHTIQSNGKSRSFILKVPDNYDDNHSYRLAFGFHWWGGTANDVASGGSDGYAWAYYGMLSQANNTTIFVAPQGIGNGWANSGGEDVSLGGDLYRIRARHSGLVLQAVNSSSGADIVQQPDTDVAGQQWRVVDQGGGTVSLVNQRSGLAMDVWNTSTADGARVSQWTSTGAANQRFQLQRG